MIREASEEDAPAIASLWNGVIRDTLITFNPVEKTADDVADMLTIKAAQGHGTFVAEASSGILGFVTYGQFRSGAGYRHSCEHTIICGPATRGMGIGRALMEAAMDHARAAEFHSMIAGVSAANPDGVAFHEKLGFKQIAVLPEVGRKFGRWLDLVLMQKML